MYLKKIHEQKGGEIMDVNKLLSVIKAHGDRQEDLANAIGLSRTRLSAKIHSKGNASFNQPEIAAIKKRYSLTSEQVDAIFFNINVS